MNQKLGPKQQEWVDALLSGKYKQGVGMLHVVKGEDDFFCCLGVLCDMNKDRIRSEKMSNLNEADEDGYEHYYEYNDRTAFLPYSLREEYGFRNTGGGHINEQQSLAFFNDKGYTFEQIAIMISANPSDYFTKEY